MTARYHLSAHPSAVAVGPQVWVADYRQGTLWRIDPRHGRRHAASPRSATPARSRSSAAASTSRATGRRCSAATSRATTRSPAVASTASSVVPCSVAAGDGVAYAAGCPNIDRLSTGARQAAPACTTTAIPLARAADGRALPHDALRPGRRRGRGLGHRRCARPPPLQDRAALGAACSPRSRSRSRRSESPRAPAPSGSPMRIHDVLIEVDPGERPRRAAHRDVTRDRRRRSRRGQRVGGVRDRRPGRAHRSGDRPHRRAHRCRLGAARGGGRAGRRLGDARCALASASLAAIVVARAPGGGRGLRRVGAALRSGSACWPTAPASAPSRTTGRSPPPSCRCCSTAGDSQAKGRRAACAARRSPAARSRLVEGCSESGVYGRLITETRQLVEIDRVDAVVGAFGWSDAVVFRELARRYPTVPFLLAGSFVARGDRRATRRPTSTASAPDIEQEQAGLATYAYRTLGWRSAATVAEDTPNGWGATAAFAAEFCALGGSVRRVWTPPFCADGALLRRCRPRSTASWCVRTRYGFPPLHPRLRRAPSRRGTLAPARSLALRAGRACRLCGVVAAAARRRRAPSPVSRIGSSPADAAYRKAFATAFPGLPPQVAGNFLVLPYYTAVDALVQSLEQTNGEPGRIAPAARSARVAPPAHAGGPMRLDRNRQAIAPATLEQFDGTAPRQRPPSTRCAGFRQSTRRSAACSRRSSLRALRQPGCRRARAAALGALNVSSRAAGSSR